MAVPTTVAELADATINVLETQGWCQRTYQRGVDGPVCLLGGLNIAAANHGITSYHKAQRGLKVSQARLVDRMTWLITDEARKMFPRSYGKSSAGGVPSLNDFKHRTKDQIIRLLLRVKAANGSS